MEISVFNANSVTLITRRGLRRLIRVYSVCQYACYGTPGINGLRRQTYFEYKRLIDLINYFEKMLKNYKFPQKSALQYTALF